jgi:putative MATE family efflux protein
MKDLTTGHEAKVIIYFALPLLGGNFLQQAYSLTDSVIVGQFLGKDALAAIGASYPIFYALIAFVIGIGSGATVVISQYYGAKDFEKVKRATGTIFIFLLYASIVLTVVGIAAANLIFEILNVDEEVLPSASLYFRIYMTGMVAFFGFNTISSVLRGMGDSMTSFWFLIIATIANIALDLLFIVVFEWGIAGAAIATVIAHFIAFTAGAWYLHKRHAIISFNPKDMVFDKELFMQSLRIGLPTGFQQTFIALGLIALIRIVNNYESSVLAAYTVASRIDSLAAMPALSLSSALAAFVGQNIGAGRVDRIKRGYQVSMLMVWVISLILMTMVYLTGDRLMALFTSDTTVIDYGRDYLIIVSSFYIVFSSMFITHGMLRGAGATLIPMFISLISLWIGRIPLALLLSSMWGVNGIWWAIPCSWVIGLAGSLAYYLSGKWKNKTVVNYTDKIDNEQHT